MKYRAEIDGLRALAVIPVILYHADFKPFSGGYIGVDIFFVISGYLITSVILSEQKKSSFSLISFYERRTRRIFPALFVVMFACLPFAWFWMLPESIKQFSDSLIATGVFASNFFLWRTTNYFDFETELKPLIHTWSLSLEEQYYILFPLFLVLTWKLSKRYIVGFLAVIFVISLSSAHLLSVTHSSFAFYMLPARVWELLIGVFIAFYYNDINTTIHDNFIKQFASLIGLTLISYSIFAYNNQTPFPSLYTLIPTIGAGLIIIFATEKTIVGKLLRSRLFVGIGLISYSAYLWHQPIFAFSRLIISEPNNLTMIILIIFSIFMAFLSWKFIEQPIRRKPAYFWSQKVVFLMSALIIIIFILLGWFTKIKEGFPMRLPMQLQSEKLFEFPSLKNGYCFYSISEINLKLKVGSDGTKCKIGDIKSNKKALLIGDSFAGQYEPFWDQLGQDLNVTINSITTNSCFPSLNPNYHINEHLHVLTEAQRQCKFNRSFFSKNFKNYNLIIIGAAWGDYLNSNFEYEINKIIEKAKLNNSIIIIMAAPKYHDTDLTLEYKRSIISNIKISHFSKNSKSDVNMVIANNKLKSLSENSKNVFFIDRETLFILNDEMSDWTSDGRPYAHDRRHISIHGSLEAVKNFKQSTLFNWLSKNL
jgi:peptidoglycan/LPS O-acetylase OafA/YrhL